MGRPNTRSFTDDTGDSWELKINVHTAGLIKDETEIDILEAARGKFQCLQDIVHDPYNLGAVLWTLCREQAVARGLDEKQFAERFASADVLDQAADALLHALICFFPQRVRPALERTLQKLAQKWEARTQAGMETAMRAIESPEMDQQIDDLINSAFSQSAGSSPESSESIPAN